MKANILKNKDGRFLIKLKSVINQRKRTVDYIKIHMNCKKTIPQKTTAKNKIKINDEGQHINQYYNNKRMIVFSLFSLSSETLQRKIVVTTKRLDIDAETSDYSGRWPAKITWSQRLHRLEVESIGFRLPNIKKTRESYMMKI